INRTTKFPYVMSVIFSMGLEVWFGESAQSTTKAYKVFHGGSLWFQMVRLIIQSNAFPPLYLQDLS
ncbi:hypothetical protein ACVZHT_06560, partial [Vibrio diabolicus]